VRENWKTRHHVSCVIAPPGGARQWKGYMMAKSDWSRPRFQISGKIGESINGAAFGLPAAPRKPQPSRKALKAAADHALRDFIENGGKVKRGPSPAPLSKPAALASRPTPTSSTSSASASPASTSKPTSSSDEGLPWD
jgi:hypothetical protein